MYLIWLTTFNSGQLKNPTCPNCQSEDRDTVHQYHKTIGDKGRLVHHLRSPLSGPKSCTWTHQQANCQLFYMYCTCVRGNKCPHQQMVIVCIHHSIAESGKPKAADTKQHLLTIFTPQTISSFQMAMLLWKCSHAGMFRWDKDEKWGEPSVFPLDFTWLCLLSLWFCFSCAVICYVGKLTANRPGISACRIGWKVIRRILTSTNSAGHILEQQRPVG